MYFIFVFGFFGGGFDWQFQKFFEINSIDEVTNVLYCVKEVVNCALKIYCKLAKIGCWDDQLTNGSFRLA